jgi:hypothetical protein
MHTCIHAYILTYIHTYIGESSTQKIVRGTPIAMVSEEEREACEGREEVARTKSAPTNSTTEQYAMMLAMQREMGELRQAAAVATLEASR